MESKVISLIISAIVAAILAACDSNTVYDQYDHTPTYGWEKNDTLTFYVPKIKQSGNYDLQMGLRITTGYPFMGLSLIVEQAIIPSEETTDDTLNCRLINEDGTSNGQGISYYQYNYHVSTLRLNEGDSLRIRVRHDMKREILPGISDIGFRIKRIN